MCSTTLVRFRTGVSRINGHRLCFSLAENQRLCPFCVDKTEDERYVHSECPVYTLAHYSDFWVKRDKEFPVPLYRGWSEKECCCRLSSDLDDDTGVNVSVSIFGVTRTGEFNRVASVRRHYIKPSNLVHLLSLTCAVWDVFYR